jgi:16S rRNA (uracil1498-N3)-methyltransferase
VAAEGPPRAHVFVEDLEDPVLAPGDRHHLERALRLRPGDPVTASDGCGGLRRCVLTGGARLDPVGPSSRLGRPTPAITVALAATKGERPEWAVQKLTEAGVDEVVFFLADRSVVRWEGERADRHLERLRRVAREAAMQSRRAWLPVIRGVETFASVARRPGAALADRGGDPPSLSRPVVLVGPEGGWSEAERSVGLPVVSLGEGVLRAETAAVAAGVLLGALRAGVVRAGGDPGRE